MGNPLMGSSHSPLWSIGSALRLDRRDPYLRLQNVTLFVRDQDRSLQFFVDRLGFSLVADYDVPRRDSWVAVAADQYDAKGQLYRSTLLNMTYSYDVNAVNADNYLFYDFVSGVYSLVAAAGMFFLFEWVVAVRRG